MHDKEYIVYMKEIMKIKFPIGTKEAAEVLDCSQRTVKLHCKIHNITKISAGYLIYKNDLISLMNSIHDGPGRPRKE